MKTLYGIQYLRALAAIAVVLFHAAERTDYAFAIGAAGVDVFFVISGFIMWVISENRPASPARFLSDRLRRIVPVYWLATAVMVLGGIVGLFPNLILSLQHVLASLFFVPMRSPSNGEIWPVLVQGWTLNFEMFFYAAFAAALFLPRNLRLPMLGALFAALVILGATISSDNPLFLTYTRPIILEFVAGMALGALWLKGFVPKVRIGGFLLALSLGGFATIALLRLPFDERICGPLAVTLVLGTLSLEANSMVRHASIPAFLGNASYSIYLWHTFAISVAVKLGMGLHMPVPLVFAVAVMAGVVAGSLAYLFVEKPLIRVFQRRPASPRMRLREAR
ncbi:MULTISPECIES: acyltransferase [unclassified Rhizobium]|uniref:acyltransferase family protein n=1 Tax=unclassified Rhizobium TaxID=2613769 RepID=UPI0006FF4132|nr:MULTISPECIES: acyltransferase [unclassified Rhizobium]KQV33351.1 exopolysaccharide biosynthesis protein [Rhizobium sp. Root1212]KRD22485.1 exopolysaccharide biosynthesis protein [Rhizobium sp. Root268]